jgi:hypothetical protein
MMWLQVELDTGRSARIADESEWSLRSRVHFTLEVGGETVHGVVLPLMIDFFYSSEECAFRL